MPKNATRVSAVMRVLTGDFTIGHGPDTDPALAATPKLDRHSFPSFQPVSSSTRIFDYILSISGPRDEPLTDMLIQATPAVDTIAVASKGYEAQWVVEGTREVQTLLYGIL